MNEECGQPVSVFCKWEKLRLRGFKWPVQVCVVVLSWEAALQVQCSFWGIGIICIVRSTTSWEVQKNRRLQFSLPGVSSPDLCLPTSTVPLKTLRELLQGAFPDPLALDGMQCRFSVLSQLPLLISVIVLNNSCCCPLRAPGRQTLSSGLHTITLGRRLLMT